MKINSEKLWEYIFNLATGEKVRFAVLYDDFYTTEILWDGENFQWDAGTFTSGAFFNPLYDFEVIEEGIEKIKICKEDDEYLVNKINELIDIVKELRSKE